MIDKVIDNLYLGDVQDVINEDRVGLLKMDLKITHILTVAAEGISVEKQIDGICYMFIYAFDIATQDMFAGNLLANSITYISTSTETSNGRALVHCEAGISRSVFIVAAYLMQKFQWSAAKAVEYIQTIRPIAQPNDGFIRQLRIFESCHFVADIQTVSQSSLYKKWLLDISSADRNYREENGRFGAVKQHREENYCDYI
uniref:protein-tyrosine-phosphatase n=1 Tax=Setaria digitata TaxID=48799 RepID=A0A915PGN5_9BILA